MLTSSLRLSRWMTCRVQNGLGGLTVVTSVAFVIFANANVSRSDPDDAYRRVASGTAVYRCGHLDIRPGHLMSGPFVGGTVAISPNGQFIALPGNAPHTIDLWSTKSPRKIRSITVGGDVGEVGGLSFSTDGRRLASVLYTGTFSTTRDFTGDSLRVWDVETGKEVFSIPARANSWLDPAFSPDGKWLASRSAKFTIDVSNTRNGHVVRQLVLDKGRLKFPRGNELKFSSDSKRIAAIGFDAIRVWNVADGRVEMVSTFIQSEGGEQVKWIWDDLSTGKNKRRILQMKVEDVVRVIVVGPELERAAFLYDEFVSIVNLQTAAEVTRIQQKAGYEFPAAYSPNGKCIAIQSDNRKNAIRIFDTTTGRLKGIFHGHRKTAHDLSFSADGSKLLATTGYHIHVWDVKTRKGL